MASLKSTDFETHKKKFYNEASKILIFKTDKRRNLPTKVETIEKYKNDLLQSYNAMTAYAESVFTTLDKKAGDKLTSSFTQHYKPRFIEALNFIGFETELPLSFDRVELDRITALSDVGAVGGNDDGLNDNNLTDDEDENASFAKILDEMSRTNDGVFDTKSNTMGAKKQNRTTHNAKQGAAHTFVNTKFTGMRPSDFENAFSLDPNRIAANRIAANRNRRLNNLNPNFANVYRNNDHNDDSDNENDENFGGMNAPNYNAHAIPQNRDEISQISFYNLCARTFNEMYSGDPLSLRPFIHKINSVQRLCQNEVHETTLLDAIMSHVNAIAADVLPLRPDSVDSVKNILIAKIKPESSRVVRGRMMALKSDHNNLTDFSKKVENLADHFKRSLILENIPEENANRMVVDDVIDLCRANTTSQLVKSGLIGYNFGSAKEVVAKYIIETRKDAQERQVLAFRQSGSNSGRGNNFQNANRNNFGGNRNNFNQNRNYNQNRNFNRGNFNQNQFRSNFRGNTRGRGNNRGRGNYRNAQQSRNVYYAENDQAPPSGAPQAQNVQMNRADHH